MMAQQRFEQILAYVNRRRAASVAELCAATGASEATIRRDLAELSRLGHVRKVHGGAVALRPAFEAQEADVRTKAQLQVPQKDAIARYAAAQVTDEDLVFLDAGTTTLHMVEYLDASRATFVTNGVACARRLVEKGLRAYVLGGLLKPRTEAVVGGVALEMMANYNFTKAFLGTNGISMQRGYTTPDGRGLHQGKGGAARVCQLCAGRFHQIWQGSGHYGVPAGKGAHHYRQPAGRELPPVHRD